jgi:hypothetical protein
METLFQKIVANHTQDQQNRTSIEIQRVSSMETSLTEFMDSNVYRDAKQFLLITGECINLTYRPEGNGTSTSYVLNKEGFRFVPSSGLVGLSEHDASANEIARHMASRDVVKRFSNVKDGPDLVNAILGELDKRAKAYSAKHPSA